ncbi:hypothetical protein [Streptomyces tendae]|uniref:hypothetical protein n=1 Tax=Streptomyces tendae TaxID=1932 RepID=UPI00371A3227
MRDHSRDTTEADSQPGRAPVPSHRHALLALQTAAGNDNVTQMLRAGSHLWTQQSGGLTVQRAPQGVNPPDLAMKPGEESHSELGRDSRMLNRMARYMMDAPRGEEGRSIRDVGTPHLALTVIGNQVHVAGNSGMSPEEQAAAVERLDSAGLRTKAGAGDHDAKKLVALMDGKTSGSDSGTLAAVKGAVTQPGGMQWHNAHKPSRGVVHGEMALLDEIAKAMQSDPKDKSAGLQDWPISGRKRDCLACHWAHAIFNTHIANPLGYRIVSAGTHGGVFPNWKMPGWMLANSAAASAMKKKLAEHNLGFGKGNTIRDEVKKGTGHEFDPPGPRGDEPAWSESSIADSESLKEDQAALPATEAAVAETQATPVETEAEPVGDRSTSAEEPVPARAEPASAAEQTTTADGEPVTTAAAGPAPAPAGRGRGGHRGRGGNRGRGGGRGRGGYGRGGNRGRGGHRGRGRREAEEES